MRHRKSRGNLGRTASHRRCMLANQLKSLVVNGSIVTTLPKAKELKRLADKLITVAKDNDVAARRKVKADLMLRYNTLTPKQKRLNKETGKQVGYNTDRQVLEILFDDLQVRFSERQGGYTRLVPMGERKGDNAKMCLIEYLNA